MLSAVVLPKVEQNYCPPRFPGPLSVSLSWFLPLALIPSICLASLHTISNAVILPFLLSAISSSHFSFTYALISISFHLSFSVSLFVLPVIGLTNFLTLFKLLFYVSIFPSLCQSSLSLSPFPPHGSFPSLCSLLHYSDVHFCFFPCLHQLQISIGDYREAK